MVLLLSVISVIGSILFTPLLMVLLGIIFLASIGKSLGVRKMYIKILLTLFEYGRKNIEIAQKRIRPNESVDTDLPTPSSAPNTDTAQFTTAQQEAAAVITTQPLSTQQQQQQHKQITANGLSRPAANGLLNGNHLLNRDDKLMLLPEPAVSDAAETHAHGGEVVEDDAKSTDGKEKYKDFELSHCFDLIKAGLEAIVEDEVTSRFEAEELKNWNMLTRTNRRYEFVSWRLTVIWMCGFMIRYCFLLPLRVLICFIGVLWLTICTAIVGYVPDGDFKVRVNRNVQIMCFGILSAALSAVITYHNRENVPKAGICVANHTSPIDALVLLCDNCYSLIGQKHGGFLGILQRALARASPHIWFERSEVKDRHAVATKLREHVSNPKNPPILIFPEGTCINNTSVMQFKKGSFEVGSVIYPVAIKYDPRFGDAFWNSSKYSMVQYLYMMMSSWAIVCEVWYLPPMYQNEGETAIDFANRVKSVIAHQGGLIDLVWDGQLKRTKPKKEWKERQQEEFSKLLKCD